MDTVYIVMRGDETDCFADKRKARRWARVCGGELAEEELLDGRLNDLIRAGWACRRTRDLFKEFAPDYGPNNDPWGHAMGAFFNVAGELDRRGCDMPPEWGYRCGMGGPEVDEWAQGVLDDLKPTNAELLRLGRFLHRLTARLDRAGRSY